MKSNYDDFDINYKNSKNGKRYDLLGKEENSKQNYYKLGDVKILPYIDEDAKEIFERLMTKYDTMFFDIEPVDRHILVRRILMLIGEFSEIVRVEKDRIGTPNSTPEDEPNTHNTLSILNLIQNNLGKFACDLIIHPDNFTAIQLENFIHDLYKLILNTESFLYSFNALLEEIIYHKSKED